MRKYSLAAFNIIRFYFVQVAILNKNSVLLLIFVIKCVHRSLLGKWEYCQHRNRYCFKIIFITRDILIIPLQIQFILCKYTVSITKNVLLMLNLYPPTCPSG